jgi:hypothetical protein
MKKNLFYAFVSFLFVLLFDNVTKAQISSNPQLESLATQQPQIEKSSSNVSNDLKILYDKHSANSNNADLQNKPVQPNVGMEKYLQIRGDKVLVDITVKEYNSKTRADLEKTGFKIFAAYDALFQV